MQYLQSYQSQWIFLRFLQEQLILFKSLLEFWITVRIRIGAQVCRRRSVASVDRSTVSTLPPTSCHLCPIPTPSQGNSSWRAKAIRIGSDPSTTIRGPHCPVGQWFNRQTGIPKPRPRKNLNRKLVCIPTYLFWRPHIRIAHILLFTGEHPSFALFRRVLL